MLMVFTICSVTLRATPRCSKELTSEEMTMERNVLRLRFSASVWMVWSARNVGSRVAVRSEGRISRISGRMGDRKGLSLSPSASERFSMSTRMRFCRLGVSQCPTMISMICSTKSAMWWPTMPTSPLSCPKNASRTFSSHERTTDRNSGMVWGRNATHLGPRLWKMNMMACMTMLWCWRCCVALRMSSSAEMAFVA